MLENMMKLKTNINKEQRKMKTISEFRQNNKGIFVYLANIKEIFSYGHSENEI